FRLTDKTPWWREPSSSTVLQHSETARLATDAFLEEGKTGYLQAIAEEQELPFLSTLDMEYISQYKCQSIPEARASKGCEVVSKEGDTSDLASLFSELTSGTYFPLMSDVHPPELELGWPMLSFTTRSSETQASVGSQPPARGPNAAHGTIVPDPQDSPQVTKFGSREIGWPLIWPLFLLPNSQILSPVHPVGARLCPLPLAEWCWD
uniref:Scaffolding anchor of CK1 domain-containing protein n=1 Tax=Crocodylus porosus TaxID=8502 RepID=A0A7M4F837_CROPO